MSKKIDNLASLDWDDSALIRAYDKGMTLKAKGSEAGNFGEKKHNSDRKKAKGSEAGNFRGKKHNSDRKKWREGDFCQALYPADGLLYEAQIISICDDVCIVDFLGYVEELEIEIDTLVESRGEKARNKQIRKAYKSLNHSYHLASNDESASGDDTRHNESSLMYSKKKHHYNHDNQMLNHTVDYNTTAPNVAADSTFHTTYQTPAHCNPVPHPSMLAPAFPPMPPCSNLSQDPALAAMMTSWYMAGYYTGLHQAQKNPRSCCHASQNCCRH